MFNGSTAKGALCILTSGSELMSKNCQAAHGGRFLAPNVCGGSITRMFWCCNRTARGLTHAQLYYIRYSDTTKSINTASILHSIKLSTNMVSYCPITNI